MAAGIILLLVVVLAVAYASPWWQFTIGQEVGQANVSPLSFNVTVLGSPIVIPLIWFINLVCLLYFTASGTAILIYSVVPERSYSKHLLNFAYKKPLIILIVFIVNLFVVTYLIGAVMGISIPLAGSTTLPLNLESLTMETSIVTGFTWVFGLAVVSAVLCIIAKLYHKETTHVSTTPSSPPPPPPA